MKNFFSAFASCAIIFCVSCKDAANPGQQNLEASNTVMKAILSGDVSNLDKVIAADIIDHSGPAGDIKGLDSLKKVLGKMHSCSPDMKFETIKELADGEYTFQWIHFTGTAATADMGLPIGTKYDFSAIEVSKFKDGKTTEHWEFMQPADMMKMMAMAPPPATENKMKDSATHKK